MDNPIQRNPDRDDDAELDEALADLTDALIEGRPDIPATDLHGLETVVRQLHEIIAPGTPANPAFRRRLEQQLEREWNRLYHQQPWYRRAGAVRLMALATVAVVVVMVALLVTPGAGDLGGTAQGPISVEGVVVIVVVVMALGVLWFLARRRR